MLENENMFEKDVDWIMWYNVGWIDVVFDEKIVVTILTKPINANFLIALV